MCKSDVTKDFVIIFIFRLSSLVFLKMSTIVFKLIIFVWFSFISVLCYYDEDEKKPNVLVAEVGSSVIFDCELEFPQNVPIPYLLNWNKEVSFVNDEPILSSK